MMRRSAFSVLPLLGLMAVAVGCPTASAARPNILFITVDDMNCDSVGAFGCPLPETTPNIDRLAAEGLRFQYAHVQVGNCMPSRNVMLSGRYPHNNRVEGFYQVKDPDYPVLCDLMKGAGYFTAIRGKVSHSTPYSPYAWDLILDTANGERAQPKNVHSYYESTKIGIEASQKAGKPFCLIINVSDPHKPFYAMDKHGIEVDDPNKPSRVFTAAAVPVPGFLPDTPIVRKELAHYFSSVRRADDCVGEILRALREADQQNNTVVTFLSDHGMPFPFAKTAVYHHSTRTPWIVRWPNRVTPDSVDDRHMISAVDLLPTLLDIASIAHPDGLDGRSFLPLLDGKPQDGRDMIIKEYNENAGGFRNPMRSVETRRFGYIFNPWVDGKRMFKTATTGTLTYKKMKQLAQNDSYMAARVELFDHRVVEEFYDYAKDPDALHNLINDPAYHEDVQRLRKLLEDWMVKTNDHALEAFRHRDQPEVLAAYMARVDKESAVRRAKKRKRNVSPGGRNPARRNQAKLIKLLVPGMIVPGKAITVTIPHTIPDSLGEQLVTVTLKNVTGNQRIERQIVKAKGVGQLAVTFHLPANFADKAVRVAAFIGKDYPNNLQYLLSKSIVVKREEKENRD